jgi:hypothetical protein
MGGILVPEKMWSFSELEGMAGAVPDRQRESLA